MDLRMNCAAVRQYGSVRQYVRQCVAVRTAGVCGSALACVWHCARQWATVQQCAAVCSSVRQCARLLVCDSARGVVR